MFSKYLFVNNNRKKNGYRGYSLICENSEFTSIVFSSYFCGSNIHFQTTPMDLYCNNVFLKLNGSLLEYGPNNSFGCSPCVVFQSNRVCTM